MMIAYPMAGETPCENRGGALAPRVQDANVDFAVCSGLALAVHKIWQTFNTWDSSSMILPSNLEKAHVDTAALAKEVDISPAAIDRRLREVGMLWDFWQYLRKFRPQIADADQKGAPPSSSGTINGGGGVSSI